MVLSLICFSVTESVQGWLDLKNPCCTSMCSHHTQTHTCLHSVTHVLFTCICIYVRGSGVKNSLSHTITLYASEHLSFVSLGPRVNFLFNLSNPIETNDPATNDTGVGEPYHPIGGGGLLRPGPHCVLTPIYHKSISHAGVWKPR